MSKHTPGPWEAVPIDDDRFQAFGIVCARDPVNTKASDIAAVWRRGTPAKYEANARLITAAPELAEALKAAQQFVRKARAALAKAGA